MTASATSPAATAPRSQPIQPGQDQPGYVAQLAMGGMMVEAQVEGREIRVAMMEGEAHEGRDMELWWIAGPEATPVVERTMLPFARSRLKENPVPPPDWWMSAIDRSVS